MTTDPYTYIEQALTRREEAARATGGPAWSGSVPGMIHVDPAFQREHRAWRSAVGYVAAVESEANRQHIVLHDPAAVLRRCAADRKLIELAFENAATIDGEWGCVHDADQIKGGLCPERSAADLPEIRALAEGYGWTDDA